MATEAYFAPPEFLGRGFFAAQIPRQTIGHMPSKQIDRAEAADYEKDLELFQASLDFVKAGRGR